MAYSSSKRTASASVSTRLAEARVTRVGGMLAPETGADRSQLTSSNLVQRFHSMSQEWSDLPPLPEPRSSHDAVVVGDQLGSA